MTTVMSGSPELNRFLLNGVLCTFVMGISLEWTLQLLSGCDKLEKGATFKDKNESAALDNAAADS